MVENRLSLSTFYDGWNIYQRHLVTAIAPLSMEQLALRPASHLWSIGMLATHIVGTRAYWFHHWMGEGGADIALMADWDETVEPALPAAELVVGLETTWQMIHNALERWTLADLEEQFQYSSRPSRSRQWIIWHVLEHDMHHGGEISFTLGMHHLSAIDL